MLRWALRGIGVTTAAGVGSLWYLGVLPLTAIENTTSDALGFIVRHENGLENRAYLLDDLADSIKDHVNIRRLKSYISFYFDNPYYFEDETKQRVATGFVLESPADVKKLQTELLRSNPMKDVAKTVSPAPCLKTTFRYHNSFVSNILVQVNWWRIYRKERDLKVKSSVGYQVLDFRNHDEKKIELVLVLEPKDEYTFSHLPVPQ